MAFGKKTSSIAQLKKDATPSKLSGVTMFIPKAGSEIQVRFLGEPDEWMMYKDVWDEGMRTSYPNPDDSDMEGYATGNDPAQRVSTKYLANVVITDGDHKGKVIALQMPKSVVNQLIGRYDKYSTVTDRDYVLYRTGEGKEGTSYHADPEAKEKLNVAKYMKEVLDLEDVLRMMYEEVFGEITEDDEDEEEETPKRKPKVKAKPAPAPKKRRPVDEDEDDEEEEEGEDDEEEEEETPPPKKRRKPAPEPEDDDEDEEEEEPAPRRKGKAKPAPEPEEEEEEEDDEDEEEDDEEDGDYYTEEELSAMSLPTLRELAAEYGIKAAGMKKPQIIAKLLDGEF